MSTNEDSLTTRDKARIVWASARYDFWLDLNSVPRRQRRALRAEFKSNLTEASADVGLSAALTNLGGVRRLAAETTQGGRHRSRWLAGWVVALSTFALLLTTFLFLTLYYSEGVLDAGATEPVSSSLFPFFGSSVTVDPSNGDLAVSIQPGPMPLIVSLIVWILVAKPWRNFTNHTSTADTHSR